MIDLAVLEALVEAGASGSQVFAAVKAMEERQLKKRRIAAARQDRKRERDVTQPELALVHPAKVQEIGERVCEILRAMPPQPDDAKQLHDAAEDAIAARGLEVEREHAVELDDGRKGYIDLVVEKCVAVELDRRLPRSLRKLVRFEGYRIAVTRTEIAPNEFMQMIDAVIAIPPLESRRVTLSHAESREKERKVSTPSKERNTSLREVGGSGGDARERMLSDEALRLADELAAEAKLEPDAWPPGWCGSAMLIQRFFNDGCPPEVVKVAVITELRRRTKPPDYFAYFEKPIARAFANFQRPLPKVVVENQEIAHADPRTNSGNVRRFVGGRAVGQGYGSATDAAIALRERFARAAEREDAEQHAASELDRGAGDAVDGSLSSG